MGCDIHLYVEHKVEGEWKSADKWTPDDDAESGRRVWVAYDDRYFHDRNYSLFAVLAGVRNYAELNTIAEPRGLPCDATTEVRTQADYDGSDGHTHSYFTVAELMAFDWTQTVKEDGWVDALTFWKWTRYGEKEGDAPAGSRVEAPLGPGKNVTRALLRQLLEELTKGLTYQDSIKFAEKDLSGFHCHVEWEVAYFKIASVFLSQVMPRLWRLGTPEDVRIVFWFDN